MLDNPYTVDFEKYGEINDYNKIVLMSNSPRRKELLDFLKPTVSSKAVNEKQILKDSMDKYSSKPLKIRASLACVELANAKSIPEDLEDNTLYIAADTIVIHDNKICNKPSDLQEAKEMLLSYFGTCQMVVTGVSLRTSKALDSFYSYTNVCFSELTPRLEQMAYDYISEYKPLDKAGAYGIQEIPKAFISYIEGDINTVIGMPVSEVVRRI